MIEQKDFENVRRLSGALLRRFSDDVMLQRLASALNYVPEQLQYDILSLDKIVQDAFPSSVVGVHVGGGVVFVPMPVIDEAAEQREICEACANRKALDDDLITPEELDGMCAACEERRWWRYSYDE